MKYFFLILFCALSLSAFSQPTVTQSLSITDTSGCNTAIVGIDKNFSYQQDTITWKFDKWTVLNKTYIATWSSSTDKASIIKYSGTGSKGNWWSRGNGDTLLIGGYDDTFQVALTFAGYYNSTPVFSKTYNVNLILHSVWAIQPYVCLVTTDSLQHNVITVEKPDFPMDSIRVEKFRGNQWKRVGVITKNQLLQITDNNSNAAQQSNTYRAIAFRVDSCSQTVKTSTPSVSHTSILLQISRNSFNQYNLSWSKYQGLPDSQLLAYYILKGTSYGNLQPYDTTQSILNQAWIDVKDSNTETAYVYVVQAIRKDGCDFSAHLKRSVAETRSNSVNTKSLLGIRPITPELDARIINGILYTSEPVSANIYQLDGKLVGSYKGKEVDLHLKPGLWIVKVFNYTGAKTFKVVR